MLNKMTENLSKTEEDMIIDIKNDTEELPLGRPRLPPAVTGSSAINPTLYPQLSLWISELFEND
jgi:hypothetical protein